MDMKQNNDSAINYYNLSAEQVLEKLNSSQVGLSQNEASSRKAKYGLNELEQGKHKSILFKLLLQFKEVMVIILIVAGLISAVLGEFTDTIIILSVVILNAVLGVVQESKAEKALEALKSMSKPFSKVKREGVVKQIRSEEVVPGDVVIVEAGDFIPADMRLIESASLKIEEAALTGESVPVDKYIAAIDKVDIVLGDRKNMAYSGSSVSYGRGSGVVTATGMKTEVGKIAGFISAAENEQTPLQKKLEELGKYLSIGVVAIAIIIFIVGVLEGREYFDMFFISVSLAVAAIPEGLPAIVTIVLALGVQKMSKKNAIMRKLPAVETLGCTEIICSDKTGTLTQNKMTVKQLFVNEQVFDVSNLEGKEKELETAVQIMTLCNDTRLTRSASGAIELAGDPTETALVSFAADIGFDKDEIEDQLARVEEIPFDSDRKLMTTINKFENEYRSLTKGAPDVLIERCSSILIDGVEVMLTNEHMDKIKAANSQMAAKALRVLAMAYKKLPSLPNQIDSQTIENDMVFVGLTGMIDPPREEVKEAVRICRQAGIRPIMITGDHRDTATAIAKELNIIQSESEVLTGNELDKISQEDFLKLVPNYSVYARVSPEHKVRIVKAWKDIGKIVAMTGDGVNDAPALKTSDIGVGMGITGTDVAKGVSDMVLADDNFATIVVAVEEGRKVYSNIRKAIQFLLSANMGEVVTLFVATFLNWSILLPIHILWINLVTDAFPALALGMEKAEKDVMMQKPRKSTSSIFSDGVGIDIVYQGILEGGLTLATFFIGKNMANVSNETAMTMAFITLGLLQLVHSLNVRSSTKSVFSMGLFSNRYLIGAIAISTLLQLIVVLIPGLREVFKVTTLTGNQWLIVIGMSLAILPIVEIVKLVRRLSASKAN